MQTAKIVFLNSPKFTGHEVDKNRDNRKREAASHIEEFLLDNDLFKNKEVSVTFSQNGVSSLVAIVAVGERKYALKMLVGKFPGDEADFLQVWEKRGVLVPHVLDKGSIKGYSYILMDFIDEKTLTRRFSFNELLDMNAFAQMGRILWNMHQAKTEGFGRVMQGKCEYPDFESWVNQVLSEETFGYVIDNNLLTPETHGSIDSCVRILRDYIGASTKSVYCHNDFSPANIFATDPFTVFDPDPGFNHPYIDLGRAIVIAISLSGTQESAKQLIGGYFGDSKHLPKLLHASIVFNSYLKFPYWHKTLQSKRLDSIRKYLESTKHFLDE